MENQKSVKNLIPIFIGAFVAWFHCIAYIPLGYIYNTYPDADMLVMTIAVIPGITATIGGLIVGKVMDTIGKKTTVIVSMILMLIGAAIVILFGTASVYVAILGTAISGFAGGTIPAANYSNLVIVAPDKLKDKVCGWNDAICTLGLMIGMFVCGLLAADGVWTKAWLIYVIVIPVLIITIIAYPSDAKVAAMKAPEEAVADAAAETTGDVAKRAAKAAIPSFIIGILILKVISGLFYASFGVFSSDFVINELQLGSSAIVGTLNTMNQIGNVVGSLFVFAWLRLFKGSSVLVSQIIIGVAFLAVVFSGGSFPILMIMAFLLYIGIMTQHSGMATIVALAPEESIVGRATGIFVSMTFIGESLCGYIAPPLANAIMGSSAPSACMKMSAYISIIIGLVSIPFFKKAYKKAADKLPAK